MAFKLKRLFSNQYSKRGYKFSSPLHKMNLKNKRLIIKRNLRKKKSNKKLLRKE